MTIFFFCFGISLLCYGGLSISTRTFLFLFHQTRGLSQSLKGEASHVKKELKLFTNIGNQVMQTGIVSKTNTRHHVGHVFPVTASTIAQQMLRVSNRYHCRRTMKTEEPS